MSNKEVSGELHKPVIREFYKRKVNSSFIDKIWGADLIDMQLISIFIQGICFLLCVIDIFSNYTWVIPLKDTKGVTIINAFKKKLQEFKCKQKIWVDEGSEFYQRSMKLFSQNNNTEMHSMHNEGKSVVAERFIRTLKNKFINT